MPLSCHKLAFILCLSLLIQACSFFSNETKQDKYAKWTVEQFVTASKQALEKEDYKKTIALLGQLNSRYPFGTHAAQTQLDLSYAYYKNSDAETALTTADYFIKAHPRHPDVDYAYYLKALINFNRETGFIDRYVPFDKTQRSTLFIQTAYLNFEELLRHFPDSQYASDARQRMIYLKNILARHELHIARFYMDREAFVAAANRTNYILQHYQGTPIIPYALETQIKAYRILGLNQLADKSEEIYDYNYPDGPLYPEANPSNAVVIPFIWNLFAFDR